MQLFAIIPQPLGILDSPTHAGLTITGNSVLGLNSSVFQPAAGGDSTTFFQVKNAAGTQVVGVDTEYERVMIGTGNPEGKLDVVGGGVEVDLLLGGDSTSIGTRTNNTNKLGRYGLAHYSNTAKPVTVVWGVSTSGNSDIYIGGGTSVMNAAKTIRFYTATNTTTHTGTERMRISSSGYVNIGEAGAAETLFELTHAQPYITLHNSTHEDSDGGRESRIIFKGEQSGEEETTLAMLEVSHDGTSDDQLGKMVASINTGAGLAEALRIDSNAEATFAQVATGVFPTAGDHLATKEYIDLAIGASFDLFLSDTDDGVVADTHVMYAEETDEAETTEDSPSLSDGPNQLALSWLSEAGVPGTSTIREGVYDCHIHLNKNSGGATTTVYWKLSYVDSNGSSGKILIATSETSPAITTSEVGYDIHAVVASEIPLGATKRLLFEVYANISVGQNVILTATLEGAVDSHISFQLPSSIWQIRGGDITIADGGTIGQSAGPLLTFDDTNDFLEITGCKTGFGIETPATIVHIVLGAATGAAAGSATEDGLIIDGSSIAFLNFRLNPTGDNKETGILFTDGVRGVGNLTYVHRAGGVDVDYFQITVAGVAAARFRTTGMYLEEGTLNLLERAAAVGDTVAYGQIWVKNTDPCEIWFTDDDGVDHQLAYV